MVLNQLNPMSVSTIFKFVSFAVIIAVLGFWFHERAIAVELENQLADLRQQEKQLSDLRAERDRLSERLLAVSPRASDVSSLTAERDPIEDSVNSEALELGEWTPVSAWKNEGRSTPHATMATFLWAAAGGDLATLQAALEFDDVTRAKALALFNSLPPETRSLYATPEELVASVTIKNIPQTSAQLSWFHQTDPEHATIGVMLAAPESIAAESDSVLEPEVANGPPSLANQNPNRLAVLVLRRSTSGWRVVVPVAAIDRIAKEFHSPAID